MTIEQAQRGATHPSPTIRPLCDGEEAEAATIFQEAVYANRQRPKPRLWESQDARHREHRLAIEDLKRMRAENADPVLVAEDSSDLVGVAATSTRISPTSSDDRRAWTCYRRLGLDRRIKGATRRGDRLAWHREGAHEALVNDARSDEPIGAYVVTRDSESCRIGPVLAIDPVHVPAVLRRALTTADRICRSSTVTWQADVPGQNGGAITALLDAGFRPRNLLLWFANGPIGEWGRYIRRSEDLLVRACRTSLCRRERRQPPC